MAANLDFTPEEYKQGYLMSCRYYKEDKDDYSPQEQSIAKMEKAWIDAELSDNSTFIDTCIKEYNLCGLKEFEISDNVPIRLKAVLFNRFCKFNERIDVAEFKEFYTSIYKKSGQ